MASVFAVDWPHRDRALRDDRSRIHFRHNIMHGGAVNFGIRLERSLVRIEALEGGQQGRVDIQNAQVPFAHEIEGKQPHEAGKADQIDAMLFKQRLHSALEVGAILAELGVIDDHRGNPGGLCNQRPPAPGRLEITSTISAGYFLSLAASINAAMFDPRPEMRTATRFRRISHPRSSCPS